ncbi:hypothetical protein BEH_17475 [Priestia filamentosa]|uniref:Polysaccharide biosynthesis protein n=1 Tax=Priestia filamentosa TaxID=1402861 RepID=A0A0H4KJD8_9BACI|nr:hypothetical protein BEH_17475 [Priestia filamentosa]
MAGKRLFTNILHLFFSTAFTRVANAITIILLAGYVGATEYGMFSLCIAYSLIAGYFTDMGVKDVVIRDASTKNANISIIMSSYIKIRIYLLIATLVVSSIIFVSAYNSNKLITLLFLLVFPTVIGLTMQSIAITYFQFTEEMKYISNTRIISAIIATLVVLLGMYLDWNIYVISAFYGISYIIAGGYSLYVLCKKVIIDFKSSMEKSLLKGLSSFVLSGLLIMSIPHIGILTIEKVLTLKEVGFYSVAYRIPTALYQIPGVVAGAFYPILFKHYNSQDFNSHLQTNVKQIKIMSFMGMLVSLPLFLYPEWIIKTLFGEQWLPATDLLQILAIVVILQSINFPLGDGFTTSGKQNYRTIILSVSVIIGVVLYYLFSLYYGNIGAAYAAVTLELTMFTGFLIFNKNRVIVIRKALLLNLIIYSLTMLISIQFLIGYNFYLGTVLACGMLIISFALIDKEARKWGSNFKYKLVTRKLR